jgi:hypothetical protein
MSGVTPKIKLFLFISIICLLINLSICLVALANNSQNINDYTSSTDININTVESNGTQNVTANNFVIASATSFLPFVDLVNIGLLLPNLDTMFLVIVTIINVIFGAIKLFLIVVIITNFIPFIDV